MNNDWNIKLIRKYGSSKSLSIIFTILGMMFAGVGVFILSIIPSIGKTIRFNGDISLLNKVGMGAIVIGALIILITFIVMQSQPKFFLYENSIRAVSKKYDRTDRFEDIDDLFIFLYGGFGYRTAPNDNWIFVGGKTSGYADLTEKFSNLHVKHRGEKLLKALKDGKTATFRYISYENAISKSFVASRNLNYPTKEIQLTKDHLFIDGKSIPVHRIADIKENFWSEKFKIIDIEGNVFFETHPSAIMSLNLLYDLLVQLQESFNVEVMQ